MLLLASSIADYSYKYWYEALTNVDATWYRVFAGGGQGGDDPAPVSGFVRRALADIRGFLRGGWSTDSGGGIHGDAGDAAACSAEYSAS
jgi:hypothetical protein